MTDAETVNCQSFIHTPLMKQIKYNFTGLIFRASHLHIIIDLVFRSFSPRHKQYQNTSQSVIMKIYLDEGETLQYFCYLLLVPLIQN